MSDVDARIRPRRKSADAAKGRGSRQQRATTPTPYKHGGGGAAESAARPRRGATSRSSGLRRRLDSDPIVHEETLRRAWSRSFPSSSSSFDRVRGADTHGDALRGRRRADHRSRRGLRWSGSSEIFWGPTTRRRADRRRLLAFHPQARVRPCSTMSIGASVGYEPTRVGLQPAMAGGMIDVQDSCGYRDLDTEGSTRFVGPTTKQTILPARIRGSRE